MFLIQPNLIWQLINAAKTAEYRNNMAAVKSDKSILDFSNIDKSLVDNSQKVMFGSQIKNTPAAEALTKISDEIGAWKNLDPAQYHTPEGLDALKQVVGGIVETIPFEQKTARMVVVRFTIQSKMKYQNKPRHIQKQCKTILTRQIR